MASSISKIPRLLHSKLFISLPYSTTQLHKQNPSFPFPSFRAARAAIQSESNPEKLAEIFEMSSQFPTFRRHRPIYHFSIRKLARSQRFDLIDRILQTHENSPSSNSEGFWLRLIMLYSSAGMIDQTIRTIDHVLKHKSCSLSEKSLCAVLSAHLKNGSTEKVHEYFKSLPLKINLTPSVVSHNLVLKAFIHEKDIQSARNWVEKMDKDGKVLPNIDSYNILLGGYLNNGDGVGFDGIVKEISKKGLEYNLGTYNYRISRLSKNKECARAKKLLDEMVSKGVKPNSASYNAIIDGFSRVGDFESATKVLKSMLADGYVSPCSFTYYTLIRSMVKEGEFDLALEMCNEIVKRRWVPPFVAMEGLVNGLIKMSKIEEAKEVVEKMKRRLKGPALDSWGKIEATLPLSTA